MKSSNKRLLSVVIVLAMVLAMLPMVAFAAAPDTLYVKPNSNWLQGTPRFAAYFFGAGETWVACTETTTAGIYEVKVPAGGYTHIIFCRMNGSAAANNWNNKWNQTKDLPLSATSETANCYVVADGSWDSGNGKWEYFDGDVPPTTESTTPSPIEYSVAGETGLCGSNWTPDDINNMMTDENKDGIYTITFKEITAGTYKFKVTDGTWTNSWPAQDYVLEVPYYANVTINFNTADNSIDIQLEKLDGDDDITTVTSSEKDDVVTGSYYVAADCNGWNAADPAYLMTGEGDIYTLTFDIAEGPMGLKVTGGNWNDGNNWGDNGGNVMIEAGPGGSSVTVTFNAADKTIAVTGSNLVEKKLPDIQTVHVAGSAGLTGFEWDPTANVMTAADGIYTLTFENVAAGNYEFKFVANGTWDMNWTAGTAMESGVDYDAFYNKNGNSSITIPDAFTEGATVILTLDLSAMDPVTGAGGKCSVVVPNMPEPEPLEYCLVGYINGADYGCNDDHANVGEYIFVDGSLTATFTEDSYIFVKSTNNAKWFLTETYTEATSATFAVGASEKMKVPGNVSLTFTLVENEDGTLTLSYEAAPAGVTVSGTATTFAEGDATVELIADGQVVATATASGMNAAYTLENVAAGTYTLKVSKLNHVAREYTVTVGEEDLAQDVKIHLIGDIDGNGKVNTGDVAKLNAHLKGSNKLTDPYWILCANVNGGSLNMGDTATLYSHIKGTKKLY